ncbi:hypothetical protein MJL33_35220, partial [Salmonella enterica subsp. enterica serovar Kentucky]|nr:hypothetical protein [Salmonella enterica subsp. enterica serovar Kentucky]
KADDPGGLTESEWKADPQQAPRAEQYNTRKTIKQTQAGLRYEQGYDPIMMESQFSPTLVMEHLGMLRRRNIDGVVLFGFTGI